MKVLGLGAAALVLAPLAFVSSANAAPFYVKASVGQTAGAAVSGVDLSDDMVYGGALGTSVGPFRIEAGADHIATKFASIVDASAWDYSATAYLDLPLGDHASLFAGAGLDHINGSAKTPFGSFDASGNGHHFSGGLAYRFAPGVIGEAQYRRISADLDGGSFGSVNIDVDTVTAGLRLAL